MDNVRKQVKVGLVMLGLLAGSAMAQQDKDYSRPLARTKNKAPEGAVSSSQTRIFSKEGDDQYEITISGGEVSAKVNGKKVPAERIRRTKDKVEILDKDGDVMKSFDIASADNGAWRGNVVVGGLGGDPDAPKPKVMIGITMSEDEDGVIVEHVYEGLPAEKAGLKEHDVIIEIEGQKGLDQKSFREALNKKDAGDKIHLKVRRDGKDQEVTVELQKFDAQKLGAGANWQVQGMDMNNMFRDNPEARKQFEEAMKKMQHDGNRAFVWGAGPEGDNLKFAPLGGGDTRRTEELHAQMEKKIAELDKKLSKINEQMERLEKLINKLSEKDGGR